MTGHELSTPSIFGFNSQHMHKKEFDSLDQRRAGGCEGTHAVHLLTVTVVEADSEPQVTCAVPFFSLLNTNAAYSRLEQTSAVCL